MVIRSKDDFNPFRHEMSEEFNKVESTDYKEIKPNEKSVKKRKKNPVYLKYSFVVMN